MNVLGIDIGGSGVKGAIVDTKSWWEMVLSRVNGTLTNFQMLRKYYESQILRCNE